MTPRTTSPTSTNIPMTEGARVRLVRGDANTTNPTHAAAYSDHANWIAGKVPVGETGTLHCHTYETGTTGQWHVVWDHPTRIRDKADTARGFRFGLSGHMLPSWLELLS